MKTLRPAEAAVLSLILLAGPAAAFNESAIRGVLGQAQAQLGASSHFALPKAAAARAGRASSTVAPNAEETQLAEALQLQNDIRTWLFAHGQRMTKEVIAEAHGNFSAGFLIFGIIGGGSADGNYSAEAYKPLLEGGEQFIVTVMDDNTLNLLSKLDQADKTAVGETSCVTQMRGRMQRFKDAKLGLSQVQANLSRFQALMTSLNTEVAIRGDRMSPSVVRAFNQLMAWAKNSNVQLKEVGFADGYSIKKASRWDHFNDNEPVGFLFLDHPQYHDCDAQYTFQQVVDEDGAVTARDAGSLRVY